MTRLTCATAILATLAAPALAGGVAPEPQPPVVAPPPVVSDWTGAYAGLEFGYVAGHYGGDESDQGTYSAVFLGYMHDFGSYVLGVEALFSNPIAWQDEWEGDDDLMRTYRFRAGYDAGAYLPYVTLGGNHLTYEDGEGFLRGAGVGVDYAVSDTFRVGLDIYYQHNDDFEAEGYDLTTVGLRAAYAF